MAKNNININRGVQDPFYRYKMPRIMAKVEGKGNGIKTVIANMTEIAKALQRPPTYPTKYFGCELGAQTNFDLKNERYIVNGEHDANKLQEILDGFIKKFVLCPECENPETVLTVKRQSIHGKCKACGHTFIVDPKQKLSTFIVKNPPPTESNGTECEKEGGGKGHENGGSPTVEQQQQLGGVEEALVVENGNGCAVEDEDWASPEPEEEEEKLTGQIGKMVIDKDMDKSMEERLDMLHQYFISAIKDGSIQDDKKMLYEAERLELKSKAPLLLVNLMFNVESNVVAQLKQHRKLLLRFCLNDEKAQRHLLGGIEQLVQTKRDTLLPKTKHIIKALYDNDLCDEDVLLIWGSKPSKRFADKELVKEMIKEAEPVLKWLKEAEEESEESEEEEVKVAFDDRSRNVGTTVEEEQKGGGKGTVKATANGKENKKNGGSGAGEEPKLTADEEVDIDNI